MIRKLLTMPYALVVAAALLASSCSTNPQGSTSPQNEAGKTETKGKIGMTCMDLTNPFFKLIANVMQQEAQKYGYEIVALSGELDPAKQNNQMSDFVAQGYDAIFLNPVDSKAAGEGVKRAHEAGIPVFTFDVQVTDEEAKDLIVSHIGSDNFQGGQLAGESMMKVTGDRGKIAIITYPEVTSCILRRDGFMDYLTKNNSKLEVVTELSGKGNRNDGYAVATDILQAHPEIVGIFAINDPSGLGAHAAVTKAAREIGSASLHSTLHPLASKPCSRRSSLTLRSSSHARWPKGLSTPSSSISTAKRSQRRSSFLASTTTTKTRSMTRVALRSSGKPRRHCVSSFNRKPSRLRELRRGPITGAMRKNSLADGVSVDELRHSNVLKRR